MSGLLLNARLRALTPGTQKREKRRAACACGNGAPGWIGGSPNTFRVATRSAFEPSMTKNRILCAGSDRARPDSQADPAPHRLSRWRRAAEPSMRLRRARSRPRPRSSRRDTSAAGTPVRTRSQSLEPRTATPSLKRIARELPNGSNRSLLLTLYAYQHQLEVDLRAETSSPTPIALRVVHFQTVREVLSTLTKHAGVKQASVEARPEKGPADTNQRPVREMFTKNVGGHAGFGMASPRQGLLL